MQMASSASDGTIARITRPPPTCQAIADRIISVETSDSDRTHSRAEATSTAIAPANSAATTPGDPRRSELRPGRSCHRSHATKAAPAIISGKNWYCSRSQSDRPSLISIGSGPASSSAAMARAGGPITAAADRGATEGSVRRSAVSSCVMSVGP
jgi:hypothetical protein